MSQFSLPHTITYWLVANSTGFSQGFDAPLTISAKVAFVTEQVITVEGKNPISETAVYAKTLIPVGAFIAQGSFTDLKPVSSAKMVLKAFYNPSMSDMAKMLI